MSNRFAVRLKIIFLLVFMMKTSFKKNDNSEGKRPKVRPENNGIRTENL